MGLGKCRCGETNKKTIVICLKERVVGQASVVAVQSVRSEKFLDKLIR